MALLSNIVEEGRRAAGSGDMNVSDMSANAPVGSTLWCDKFTTTSPYGFPGVIHEVIVFDRKLKEAERQVVYGYLSSKYTLSDVVPNDFRLSHNGSSILGTTFWEIQPHPSPGFLFGDVVIGSFTNTRTSEYESN